MRFARALDLSIFLSSLLLWSPISPALVRIQFLHPCQRLHLLLILALTFHRYVVRCGAIFILLLNIIFLQYPLLTYAFFTFWPMYSCWFEVLLVDQAVIFSRYASFMEELVLLSPGHPSVAFGACQYHWIILRYYLPAYRTFHTSLLVYAVILSLFLYSPHSLPAYSHAVQFSEPVPAFTDYGQFVLYSISPVRGQVALTQAWVFFTSSVFN